MKKALTITIAGTLFTIEEDAYQKLDGYLQSINKYFGTSPDSKEIINDIEARIAEQFLDRPNKDAVVTIEDVEKLISVMGRVEDIADESDTKSGPPQSNSKEYNDGPRKLYRDTDNAYIAGVAAGIAEYLDVDPIIMRIAFVLLAIFTAVFPVVIVYAILTLVIPAARTPAEKLKMRGGPVDLQSFKESMNEYAENLKKNGSEMKDHLKQTGSEVKENVSRFFVEGSRPRGVIDRFFQVLGKIIVMLFKIVLAVVGVGITLAGIAGIAFASFVFVNLLVNPGSPYIDFPFYGVVTGPMYFILLLVGFLVVAIPLAVIISIGAALISHKKTLTMTAATILLGIWMVSGIALATVGVRYAPAIEQRVLSSQESQQTTKVFDQKDFSKVELHGGDTVKIVPSETFAISANGRQIDLDALRMEVYNETLVVSHNYDSKICIFCFRNYRDTEITIALPEISEIRAHGAVQVATTATTSSQLKVVATGASEISLEHSGEKLTAEIYGASEFNVSGSVQQLNLDVAGASHVRALQLTAMKADIEASGASEVEIAVVEDLKADAHGASTITYSGNPKTDIEESGASEVENTNN
jgi:phage shock protein PspC (stress-responsive transcriptional regulator)